MLQRQALVRRHWILTTSAAMSGVMDQTSRVRRGSDAQEARNADDFSIDSDEE